MIFIYYDWLIYLIKYSISIIKHILRESDNIKHPFKQCIEQIYIINYQSNTVTIIKQILFKLNSSNNHSIKSNNHSATSYFLLASTIFLIFENFTNLSTDL